MSLLNKTMRLWNLAVLVVVAFWCCNGTALPIDELHMSLPSTAAWQDLAEQMQQAKSATTCRLVIEGGSNATELAVYGGSIAKAHLACTGQVMRIAIHPVLAPFARHFTGVDLVSVPNMQGFGDAMDKAYADKDTCYPRSSTLMLLCGNQTLTLLQPRIVNMRSFPTRRMGEFDYNPSFENALEFAQGRVVSIIDPFMSQIPFIVLQSQYSDVVLYVKGGVINATMGVKFFNSVTLFDGTQFTNSRGDDANVMLGTAGRAGGAVNLRHGHGMFRDCLFTNNQVKSHHRLSDRPGAGLGGAVFVQGELGVVKPLYGSDYPPQYQTSATFVDCAFTDNTATQLGGAIAVVGVNTSITNCTFTGNSATRGGSDIFSSDGGTLNITGSNIPVVSSTVVWERLDSSQCLRGDFFHEGMCRRCAPNMYSLAIPVPASCTACPANAQCDGGDALLAKNGSFRVSTDSKKIMTCPRAGACVNGTCATGHQGAVCGSCQEGYAPSAPFKCVKCKSKGGALAVFVASTLVLLVFAGVAVQLTLTSNRENSSNTATHPTAGDMVKLLALFLQYTSIIGSLPVPWPRSLLALITASDWVFAGSADHTLVWVISPFECALKGLRVPPAMLKQLVYLLMPAFVAFVLVLFFVSVYKCCCRSKTHTLRLTVVLLVSAFFTFPIVLRAAFSFFGCFRVVDPTWPHSLWWVQAMAQPCYQGAHRVRSFAVGLPFLIVCCSAPLVLSVWLWRNSARMGEPDFRERYGHLYRLYRAHAYWYEPVILIQTIVLVALAVFASQIGNYTAVVLTGLHIAMALQLLQIVRPYAAPLLHRLHVASLRCLLLNVFVALMMFDQPAGVSADGAFKVEQAAAAAFSLIMSACFIIASCACICIYYIRGPGRAQVRNILARWCVKASDKVHMRHG